MIAVCLVSWFRALSVSGSPERENNDQIYLVWVMILIPNISVTVPKPSAVLEGFPNGGDTLMMEFCGAEGGFWGGWENRASFVLEPET